MTRFILRVTPCVQVFWGSKNETRVLVKPLGYLASPCGLDVVNLHFLAEIRLSGIILSLE